MQMSSAYIGYKKVDAEYNVEIEAQYNGMIITNHEL